MPSAFPILFTGRELDFHVPKFTEMNKAADNLQRTLDREAIDQKQLQKEFRENMDMDLETLASNHASSQMNDMQKAYTDKYTKVIKDNNGKISNDILLEMKKDQNAMKARQGEWLQSEQMWKRDKALIEQAGGQALYDMDKYKADTEKFLATGIYKPNSLEFSGVNMSSLFDATKWQGRSVKATQDVQSVGGKDIITTTTQNTTDPEEAKQFIAQTILSNPRYLKGAQKEFAGADDKVKMKYLKAYDTDGNGKISADEMGNVDMSSMNIMDNPIMQWAMSQDGYLPKVMRSTKSVEEVPRKVVSAKADDPATVNIEYETADGKKIKTTLKGNDAVAYLKANPETPKGAASDIADSPYGKYEKPIEDNGRFAFKGLKPAAFNFDRKVSGIDDSGGEIKIDKFRKKHGALTLYEVSTDGNMTLQADDGTTITVKIDDMVNPSPIYGMRVKTPEGDKSIGDIMGRTSGPSGLTWK